MGVVPGRSTRSLDVTMGAAEFRMQYNEAYLLEAMSRHRAQLWWRGPHNRVLWTLAAAFFSLTVIAAYTGWSTATIPLSGATGAFLGAILLGGPIDAWTARRRLRKSPFHNNSLTFLLSATELHVAGNNEDSHLKWTAYSKARRFSDGLLLYQGPYFFNWLPDSAASGAHSIDSAQELARANIKDYRDV